MNIINTVNSKRFSLNGIEYLKNYVTEVHGARIEVFNCYERKDVLIPLIAYNQFKINGVVYSNANQTQAALLEVLYSRATLGTAQPDIDQDNIDIVKRIKVTSADIDTIVNKINTLPGYTLGDKQSLWFVINVISRRLTTPLSIGVIHAVTSLSTGAVYKYKMMNYGKGDYGQGGMQLTAGDIELVYVSAPTLRDIEDEPSTAIINFGTLSNQTVGQWLNAYQREIVIQEPEEGYTLLRGSIDKEDVVQLWVGEPGSYGSKYRQSSETDFQPMEQITAGPIIPLYEQILLEGNETTLYAIHKDDESTAMTAYGNSLKHTGTDGKEVTIVFDKPESNVVYSIPGKQSDDVFAMQSDINGLTISANQLTQEVYLKNSSDEILAILNVAFLNNEGTTFHFNDKSNTLELKNDEGEVVSTIPVSNFIANVVNSAAFSAKDATVLEFKDSEGNVVFQITATVNNISGLQNALNNKVPYIGATSDTDLGSYAITAGSVWVWNKILPVGSETKTIFGVYVGDSAVRSLYVYVDSAGKQHVNNRGGNSASVTNTAFGVNALANNVGNTGIINTGIGYSTCASITSGHRNAVFGGYSGTNITTGAFNTLIGAQVGTYITTSDRNTIIGQAGANCLTTGRKNTLIGRSVAGGDADNGNFNGLSTGSSNVIITHGWGSEEVPNILGITSGNYNTLIGYVYGLQANDSNRIILADGQANRVIDANMLTKEIKIAGKTPILAPYVDVIDSTTLTGSITETILKSYLIAANDISVGIIDFSILFDSAGTNGTTTIKLYKNTINSLTGATQIAVCTKSNTTLTQLITREFALKTNNTIVGWNALSSAGIPNGTSGVGISAIAFNPTVNNYLIITAQLGNTSDSITQKSFTLTYRRAT